MGKSTMKIAWITDIHLDFLNRDERFSFYRAISGHRPDALLIGGDIATASTFSAFLLEMESRLPLPIYFVLGNHDFYGSSVTQVHKAAKRLTQDSDHLFWLPEAGIVALSPSTCLIGHGSWADGRYGNYEGSTVMLNDYIHIKDFKNLSKDERLYKLHELGDSAAQYIEGAIRRAMKKYRKVILLTHVPPFEESCRHGGKPGHPDWLPHFACKAVGDLLQRIMNDHRECHLTILCGHTHERSIHYALPNLSVITGTAEYGKPEIQEIFNPDHEHKLASKNSSHDNANHNRKEQ
jgi:predicted MPP superfamily phosphohydrolase